MSRMLVISLSLIIYLDFYRALKCMFRAGPNGSLHPLVLDHSRVTLLLRTAQVQNKS
jgi:hypothetical protein